MDHVILSSVTQFGFGFGVDGRVLLTEKGTHLGNLFQGQNCAILKQKLSHFTHKKHVLTAHPCMYITCEYHS